MTMCVKCGEVKGIYEVNGELYCNACYQMQDEKIRKSREEAKDLEEPEITTGEKITAVVILIVGVCLLIIIHIFIFPSLIFLFVLAIVLTNTQDP